jgi:hypothetical protein
VGGIVYGNQFAGRFCKRTRYCCRMVLKKDPLTLGYGADDAEDWNDATEAGTTKGGDDGPANEVE